MSWLKSASADLRLRPLRFLIVGLANTGLGLAAIYLSKLVLHFGDVAANAIGYALGLLVAYALNSTWTFAYSGHGLIAASRFLLAFMISYGANLFVVWTLIEQASVNGYVAQAAGIPPYTICFYVLCKWFVFRDKRPMGLSRLQNPG